MDNFEEKYGNEYDDLKLYSERSMGMSILLGIVGAVIGSLPGFALWLLLARLGYISSYCGAILAAGAFYGYDRMTKKNPPPELVGILTGVIVMLGMIVLASCIDWAWELSKQFKETVYPAFKDAMMDYDLWTSSEIKSAYSESLMEEFGFSEASFSNCFVHLGTLLDYFELKLKFGRDVIIGVVCALVFGIAVFKKTKKTEV